MKKFDNAYDAGYDAGLNGANTNNSHFSWFATKENLANWQRGNNDGSYKRELDSKPMRERVKSTFKK